MDALLGYAILDTLPEQAYEDLVRLAQQVCGVSIALITLIDRDRQWFKAKRGLELDQLPRGVALCAHTILRPHELTVVEDVQQDPRFASNPLVLDGPRVRFYAGVPLTTSAGEALGSLCVMHHEPRRIDPEQLESLRALARQVMVQLELHRSLIRLRNAQDAAAASEERLRAVIASAPTILFMVDRAGHIQLEDGKGLAGLGRIPGAAIGRKYADEFATVPELVANLERALGGESFVATLEFAGKAFEVAYAPRRDASGAVVEVVGVATDITTRLRYEQQMEDYQARLEKALEQLEIERHTDALTGVGNRRALLTRLDEELNRAARNKTALSLLMLDIDYFNAYNDSFGHGAGNVALERVAKLLQERARNTDFVARYGGEEFVVLLPGTELTGAQVLAERFRKAVELADWPKRSITVSIGVATQPGESARSGASGGELIAAADTAMYAAKEEGRNRVELANPLPPRDIGDAGEPGAA
jgi:diguanylate cyclase (GGDEF)-like protein/PAS domain S-box-containing protein